MTALVMFFCLVAGALLQSLIPTWRWAGQAQAPVLLGLVVYYALAHDQRRMLQAAVVGGLLQDALGLVPWGYSAFAFCVVGLSVHRCRELVFEQQWLTHLVFGAVASGAATLLVGLLLRAGGTLQVPLAWAALKVFGAVALGAVVVPAEFAAVALLDRRLGNLQAEEA